jgi:hypothetical protein
LRTALVRAVLGFSTSRSVNASTVGASSTERYSSEFRRAHRSLAEASEALIVPPAPNTRCQAADLSNRRAEAGRRAGDASDLQALRPRAVRAAFAGRNRKDGSSERFIALGSLILDTISVEQTMGMSWFLFERLFDDTDCFRIHHCTSVNAVFSTSCLFPIHRN